MVRIASVFRTMGTMLSSNNAKLSPGYPTDNDLMQQLAKKAVESFPPPFLDEAQVGSVETPEGTRAVLRGRGIRSNADLNPNAIRGFTSRDYPTKQELRDELGGPDGLFCLFGCHYMRMFEDPRMNVLFDTRHDDTNVNALEHGKRVASALMDRWYGTSYFRSLGRGFSAFFAVTPTHQRAKACPMRPVKHQNHRKFTTTQRDAWIGHVMCAAEEVGSSEHFQLKLGTWLAANVDVYAPFVNDDIEFQFLVKGEDDGEPPNSKV